jgi:transposase-like protein
MSSVTEEDGMAKRASQVGDARTSDRTSARRLGTELSTCGKRRRWTPEQKHKIVAEGMEPDVSAAIVAGRHGISAGQFYTWRQQLLLRRALDAGADSVPNLASIDATTSAPRVEPAIAAPPELGTPTAAAAPVAPDLPDDRVGVTRPDGVAGRLDEDCGVEHALTTDRRSVLKSLRGALVRSVSTSGRSCIQRTTYPRQRRLPLDPSFAAVPMRWSRQGANLPPQVRCAVYNGTLGSGYGQRFHPANDTRPHPQAIAA